MTLQDRKNERVESINHHEQEDTGKLCDLSISGLSCCYSRGFEKDTLVVVILNTLELKARVVYCQENCTIFRIGLNFGTLSAAQQKKVSDLVDQFSTGTIVSCIITP
jgi:hypothetical protein